jgi:hypothetical protein
MVPVLFDKHVSLALLEDLENGRPLEPQRGDQWTTADVLLLAGACLFGILGRGPVKLGAEKSVLAPRWQDTEDYRKDILDAFA